MGGIMRATTPVCLSKRWGSLGAPVRSRLLGKINRRNTKNEIGVLGEHCPCGCVLAFGRNEGAGLRCLYHSWSSAATAVSSAALKLAPASACR
jgi:phthalate 4,5-dioxygenase oxygenase subunit